MIDYTTGEKIRTLLKTIGVYESNLSPRFSARTWTSATTLTTTSRALVRRVTGPLESSQRTNDILPAVNGGTLS